LFAGRLDDPGRHQLLKHHILAAGLVEPQLVIHRGDRIQQPTHSRASDFQSRRLLRSPDLERQLVLAGRDPLGCDRLQQLHLGVGVSRAEVLDIPRPA